VISQHPVTISQIRAGAISDAPRDHVLWHIWAQPVNESGDDLVRAIELGHDAKVIAPQVLLQERALDTLDTVP
jgi:hypothetical protein